jgi:sugar lactone lactonase YvrE
VQTQRLYWIDRFGNKAFRSTAAGTEVTTWDVPANIGSMALRRSGEGAIVSLQSGFLRWTQRIALTSSSAAGYTSVPSGSDRTPGVSLAGSILSCPMMCATGTPSANR